MTEPVKPKHPGGRPTAYTPELVETALDYLESYKVTHEHEFPSVVGLCKVLNRSTTTLYRWADEKSDVYHEEFSDILRACKETQQLVLLNNGVNNTFNAQITKLVLGKHGYHDKQDAYVKEFQVTIGGKDADTL